MRQYKLMMQNMSHEDMGQDWPGPRVWGRGGRWEEGRGNREWVTSKGRGKKHTEKLCETSWATSSLLCSRMARTSSL